MRRRFDELLTARLRLRRWRPADRDPFAAMNADPEVMRYFAAPLDRTASDALVDRIESRFEEQGYGLWAVERLGDSAFLGFTGLNPMPPGTPGAGEMEVGWRLARTAWGHGYATEAALAALDVAFGEVGLPRVWSITTVGNERSQAVMRRLGLVEHSRYAQPGLPPDHELSAAVAYAGSSSTWTTRTGTMAPMTNLTGVQVAEAGLTGWANLFGALQTRVATSDFATGLALVDAIGAEAEQMDHHPDLDLRYGHLGIRLSSHDVGGLTGRDIRLARRISALVAAAGLELSAAGLTRVELGLDTPDASAVLPFWAAVLALEPPAGPDADELPDPSTALPTLWFQKSGREEPRQRWHPDLWIDPAEVQPRIDAAVAAGGTLVSAESAPRFWVLADPEGNLVCFCTWQERD